MLLFKALGVESGPAPRLLLGLVILAVGLARHGAGLTFVGAAISLWAVVALIASLATGPRRETPPR
jgi:hypothetical protein